MAILLNLRNVVAALKGHQAAATGAPRVNPYLEGSGETEAAAWRDAYDAVEIFRARGLDPHGHQPNIPQLCVRDVRAVCNCCKGCRSVCTVARHPPSRLSRILRKVFT